MSDGGRGNCGWEWVGGGFIVLVVLGYTDGAGITDGTDKAGRADTVGRSYYREFMFNIGAVYIEWGFLGLAFGLVIC